MNCVDSYCGIGRYNNVLPLIEEMKRSNVKPDEKIFSTVLAACGRDGNLEFGKAFHEFIVLFAFSNKSFPFFRGHGQ